MSGPQLVEGLITRIGRWIDHKWAAKATWLDVQNQETECSARHIGVLSITASLEKDLKMVIESRGDSQFEKDLADLKTRMEKMELYAGMTRKVDPTKPPVVKSAFQM